MPRYEPITSNDFYMVQMLKNIKKVFVPNVKPGSKVVIVVDTRQDPLVWQVAAQAIDDLGGEPIVTMITPRPADYYPPPDAVVEALKHCDLGVLLATTSMFHSAGCHEVMAQGTPLIVMDGGMTREMFTQGAVTADYGIVKEICYRVAKGVFGDDPDQIRMTSDYGTDLTCSVKGRMFMPGPPKPDYVPLKVEKISESDLFGARKGSKLYGIPFPGGEVNTAPIEDSGSGMLVVDTTIHNVGKLEQPIRITIEKGTIVKIEGGHQADELRDYLTKYGDENSWRMPTEFSIGTNYAARVTGVQREDKNILGCVHVGLGRNDDVGGKIASKLHMDGVVLRPTVYVDGVKKIDHGRILCLEEDGFYERLGKL